MFIDGKFCYKCQEGCDTCSNSFTCDVDSCLVGYTYLEDGTCRKVEAQVGSCPSDHYSNPLTNQCIQCHYSCLTCFGPGENRCSSCHPREEAIPFSEAFELYRGSCRCPLGKYFEHAEVSCYNCDESCLTCSGPSDAECTKCKTSGYKPFPIGNGTCYPCSSELEEYETECTDQVYKFTFEKIEAQTVKFTTNTEEKPLPGPPARIIGRQGISAQLDDRLVEILKIDETIKSNLFNFDMGIDYVFGTDFTAEYVLNEEDKKLNIFFNFLSSKTSDLMRITIKQPNIFENYTPETTWTPEPVEPDRILQAVSNPNDPVLLEESTDVSMIARREPENVMIEIFEWIGTVLAYFSAVVLLCGVIFMGLKVVMKQMNIYEIFHVGMVLRFMSKLPYLNLNYGALLSRLMDKFFLSEMTPMLDLQNEALLRSKVIGKFLEYTAPILIGNSIAIVGGLYLFTSLLNVVSIFLLKNKIGKIIGFAHYLVASIAIIDVTFYSMVELRFHKVGDAGLTWWIMSIVCLLFVCLDLFHIFKYNNLSKVRLTRYYSQIDTKNMKDQYKNITLGITHPFEGYANLWQMSYTKIKNIFTHLFGLIMAAKWIILTIPIVFLQEKPVEQVWTISCIFLTFFLYTWWVTAYYDLFTHNLAMYCRVLSDFCILVFLFMGLIFAYDPDN